MCLIVEHEVNKIIELEEVRKYERCNVCLSEKDVKSVRLGYDGVASSIRLCSGCRQEVKKIL